MRGAHGGGNESAADELDFAEFDARRRPEDLEASHVELCPVGPVVLVEGAGCNHGARLNVHHRKRRHSCDLDYSSGTQ